MEHNEPHSVNTTSKLNWLRAAVLGANDGIVSIAGLVVGVAGATNSTPIIFTAGMAGIVAGAISMAAGEYVSVSSSRDTEKALLKKEKFELENYPEEELEELAGLYEKRGLSKKTAKIVASELTKKDAYKAHLDAELKNFKKLNLSNNRYREIPKEVFDMTNLSEIYLSGNSITDSEIQNLKQELPNLKVY